MKPSEEFYKKYEYLANKYANKIFSYQEISFDYEDLLQEFRMKLFTSIKSYGRRWSKYRKGEASKPVPIRFYLEAACANKARDFIKYISRENHKTSIEEINYDIGIENNDNIDPSVNEFILNDVNLLEGLFGKERAIFSLYLRGFTLKFLHKIYHKKVEELISSQKNFLITKYGNELIKAKQIYSSYNVED